jgi:hypothetical protein
MDEPTQGGGAAAPTPPMASDPGMPDSWGAAATAAGPAPTATPAQPQTPASKPGGDAATTAPGQPGAPPAAQPPAVTPVAAPPAAAARVPRKGLGGFIDKMADSLAGTDTSRVRTDPDGNLYIQHETPTRGQQWLKIAVEALTGAGAGLAAGRGEGNQGKSLQAGIQAGQQMKQAQSQEEKDQQLQVANSQMLKHQIVAQAFDMQRKVTEASQHDVEFSEGQADRLLKQGGKRSTHIDNLQDLTKLMRETPNFNKDQVGKDIYTPVATYGPDGKPNGFDVYAKTPGSDEEMQPAGTKVPFFNPVTGEITYQQTSEPKSAADINAMYLSAGNARQKYLLDQATINEKNANAEDKKNPKARPEAPSVAAEHQSVTDLNRAKLKRLNTGADLPDGTPNPRFEAMAQALYNGDILPADLKREAKGASLDPNEVMGRAVELGTAAGKPFSSAIIEQEHKFASSPKTQAALDGIDRVIGSPGVPGYMDQMLELAKKADLAAGPTWTAPGARNSVGLAVKRFFGDNAAKNFQTSVSETRRSIAGLIGNPLLGGSETDKKLQQADEMLGENPTLENVRGAATILKQALATQKQSIVGNNRYLQKRYGAQGQQHAPAADAAAPAPIIQQSPSTGQFRHSIDGGKTWLPGKPQ